MEEFKIRLLIGRLRESKKESIARMHGLHFKMQLTALSDRENKEYWSLRTIFPLEEEILLVKPKSKTF